MASASCCARFASSSGESGWDRPLFSPELVLAVVVLLLVLVVVAGATTWPSFPLVSGRSAPGVSFSDAIAKITHGRAVRTRRVLEGNTHEKKSHSRKSNNFHSHSFHSIPLPQNNSEAALETVGPVAQQFNGQAKENAVNEPSRSGSIRWSSEPGWLFFLFFSFLSSLCGPLLFRSKRALSMSRSVDWGRANKPNNPNERLGSSPAHKSE